VLVIILLESQMRTKQLTKYIIIRVYIPGNTDQKSLPSHPKWLDYTERTIFCVVFWSFWYFTEALFLCVSL